MKIQIQTKIYAVLNMVHLNVTNHAFNLNQNCFEH